MSPSRKAAKRPRSASDAHSCPAAAITPAWCSGSGRTTSAHGCTARPSAAGGTGRGVVRVMPSGASTSRGDGVVPRGAAHPRHQLAEQAEAEVGVVEPPGGTEDDVGRRRARGPRASRRACAPTSRRGSRPRRRPGARAAAPRCGRPSGVPGRCRSSGSSRASRPSSRSRITDDGGDGLADRPEPVLDVGVRLGHLTAPGRPGQPAVPDDPGDQARAPGPPAGRGPRGPAAVRAVVGRTGSGMTATVSTRDRGRPRVRRRGRRRRAGQLRRCGWPAARTRRWPAAGRRRRSASSVVPGDHRSTRRGQQRDDDVGDEDAAVDRAEDLARRSRWSPART